jgi:N6-L-threonylcarbamoyladenine synthase
MRVLGIESSCDETAVAVVESGQNVLSSVVSSQVEAHAAYGGVVPDLAARMHIEAIGGLVDEAMRTAGLQIEEIDAIAVTSCPGLIGSLLIGTSYAQGLALAAKKPLFAIDHIEGHIWSGFMSDRDLQSPTIALVVSGGHTALYRYDGLGKARMLSRTVDDAAGEAFDKVAAILDLPYPGGPEIDRAARDGNPKAFDYPRGRVKGKPMHFSFSGLKTSVLYSLKGQDAAGGDDFRGRFRVEDVAASFQAAIVEALVDRAFMALEQEGLRSLIVCGGVAANSGLRASLTARCARQGVRLVVPPLKLCTDNAMMIAGLGLAYAEAGFPPAEPGLDAEARSPLSR